jgi:hypothetical protein
VRTGALAHRLRLAAVISLAACGSGGTSPAAGTLTVSLTTPNSNDGAVLFTVTGGPVESVESDAHLVYTARLDANTLRVIVIGQVAAGPIARIQIPDRDQATHYAATVLEVASRKTYLQRDPEAYRVTLDFGS